MNLLCINILITSHPKQKCQSITNIESNVYVYIVLERSVCVNRFVRFQFNMKQANIAAAFAHITLLFFVARVDAHTLSSFEAPLDFNESLLQSSGANFGDNVTHLRTLPLPLMDDAYTHVWPVSALLPFHVKHAF